MTVMASLHRRPPSTLAGVDGVGALVGIRSDHDHPNVLSID
jgi:hypothetical protein